MDRERPYGDVREELEALFWSKMHGAMVVLVCVGDGDGLITDEELQSFIDDHFDVIGIFKFGAYDDINLGRVCGFLVERSVISRIFYNGKPIRVSFFKDVECHVPTKEDWDIISRAYKYIETNE